jgi:glycine cleavage system regulatory protein
LNWGRPFLSKFGLIVKTPTETAEKIIQIAQGAGGFLVTSNINGAADATTASLSIRVPAEKFDEVRAQIRKLTLRVDGESLDAQDVTKQYVDQEARLRNLRAQEQQYLGILRKAATVKDTLEVSEKLNEARGAIEERQAEFEALSKQVETVAINITLRAEADAQVFGLNWRPLYQLKIAAPMVSTASVSTLPRWRRLCSICPRSCFGCSRSSLWPPSAGGF